MTSATSGRTPVHTDWSSLLLMLLFIFLRSGIGNVGAMTERVPAPVHRKKKSGQIPCSRLLRPCGPGQQGCIASSNRVDPSFSFTPFTEKQGEGGP